MGPIRRHGLPSLAALVAAGCVCASVAAQQPAGREPAAATLERLAKAIMVFGADDFIFGFRDHSSFTPRAQQGPVREFSTAVDDHRWTAGELLPLLSHGDAKVRTLALIGLYGLEDPQLLPAIFRVVRDTAPTFPAMVPRAQLVAADAPLTPERIRTQTVGEIATAILKVYLESGGYFYGPLGVSDQPGFEAYWKAHAARRSSAGWWTVRLARAGHASSPTPPERHGAIRLLRAEIDKLPDPERTYVLLWLNGEMGSDILVSEVELTGLAERVGPDLLVDILSRRIRSDDPDLQPKSANDYPYARMRLFVLQHATRLLRPADAQTLLAQEAWERDFQAHHISSPMISPWWAIAAAELNEKDRLAVLTAAHDRFSTEYDSFSRLELTRALWRLEGESQAAAVADWFYRELGQPYQPTWAMSGTLDALLRTGGRRNPILARTIIEDPRFETLNWKSLEALATLMNSWNGKEIVAAAELAAAWSPRGIDFFETDREAAIRQYPTETAELLKKLGAWRALLKQSVAGIPVR